MSRLGTTALLCCSMALGGCVGGTVMYPEHDAIRVLGPESIAKRIRSCKGTPADLSEHAIRESCGEPTKIEAHGSTVQWHYHRELSWSGVVIFAIIPVPLMVPTGYEEEVLEFSDGSLISVEQFREHGSIAMCGLIMIHGTEFKCFFGD